MAVLNLVNLWAIISALLLIWCHVSLSHVPVNRDTLQILRNIENSINHDIDPCDDFYEYACGNFKNLPNESVSNNLHTWSMINYDTTITNMINQEYPIQKQTQSIIDKVRIFYRSCENLNNWELLRYLDEVKPAPGLEWPLVKEMFEGDGAIHSWPSQHFDVLELVSLLNSYGLRNIFINYEFYITIIPKSITLWTSEHDELQPKVVDDILRHFGFSTETATKYRDEILQVHEQWQLTFKSFSHNEEKLMLSYSEVRQSYPAFASFLEKSMPGNILESNDFVLKIFDIHFIQYLMAKQWQPAEKRKFCNYLMIKYLQHVKKNHKTKCSSDVRTKLGLAVTYMYYESHYLPEAQVFQDKISQIIKDVHDNLWEMVSANRINFNEAQMEYLKKRLNTTSVNIGDMPENVNMAVVEEFYSTIPSMDINNFYKNDLLLLRQQEIEAYKCKEEYTWSCLRDYKSTPFNILDMSVIVVPFTSISLPFFHYKLDDLFSLSAVGVFLGHEFTHSIDVNALTKSGDALFENVVERTDVRYTLDCWMQQNPSNYMYERLSDLAGFRAAYRTYSRSINPQPNFTRIPWQQLFFLNVAQVFCTKEQDLHEDHDTSSVRVREVAMNSEEFATAFQCPLGSRMNPVNKCNFY